VEVAAEAAEAAGNPARRARAVPQAEAVAAAAAEHVAGNPITYKINLSQALESFEHRFWRN
jgi:hypothetical protein